MYAAVWTMGVLFRSCCIEAASALYQGFEAREGQKLPADKRR